MVHWHKAKRAGLHWDLRLEYDGVLKSWAIPKGMPESGGRHLAIKVSDHSMSYGKWEGTIKEGYGAGEVKIDTKGRYETLEKNKKTWKFKLLSGKYKGTWRLTHWKEDKWLISKSKNKTFKKAEEISKVDFSKLNPAQVQSYAPRGWKIIQYFDGDSWSYQLQRTYRLSDFEEVCNWVEKINDISEEMDHHARVIYGFDYVVIHLWTHSDKTITDLDLQFVEKLSTKPQIAVESKKHYMPYHVGESWDSEELRCNGCGQGLFPGGGNYQYEDFHLCRECYMNHFAAEDDTSELSQEEVEEWCRLHGLTVVPIEVTDELVDDLEKLYDSLPSRRDIDREAIMEETATTIEEEPTLVRTARLRGHSFDFTGRKWKPSYKWPNSQWIETHGDTYSNIAYRDMDYDENGVLVVSQNYAPMKIMKSKFLRSECKSPTCVFQGRRLKQGQMMTWQGPGTQKHIECWPLKVQDFISEALKERGTAILTAEENSEPSSQISEQEFRDYAIEHPDVANIVDTDDKSYLRWGIIAGAVGALLIGTMSTVLGNIWSEFWLDYRRKNGGEYHKEGGGESST